MKNKLIIHAAASALLLFAAAVVSAADLNVGLFWPLHRVSAYTGTFLWANLTILGDTLVAAVFFVLWVRRRPQIVWSALVSALLVTLAVNWLKSNTGVLRPPAVLDQSLMTIIGPAFGQRAFPSGHTATIFCTVGVLLPYLRARMKAAALLLALIVGWARIVDGVHWPSDVLVGAAIGLLGAAIGSLLVERLRWRENRTAQLIWGAIFLIAAGVLLVNYNTRYQQAVWFQHVYAAAILFFGGWEYFRLIRREHGQGD